MPTEVNNNQSTVEHENGENSCFYLNPVNLESTDPESRTEGKIINTVIAGINAIKLWSYWRRNMPLADSGISNTEANRTNNYYTRYGEVKALREKMIEIYQLQDAPSSTEEEQVWRDGQIAITSAQIYENVSQLMGSDREKLPPNTRFLEIPAADLDDSTIILDKFPPILHDMGNDMMVVSGWLGHAKRSPTPQRFEECLRNVDHAVTDMDAAMDTYADDLLEKFPNKELDASSLGRSISTWGGMVLKPLGIQLILEMAPEIESSAVMFSKSIFSRILKNVAQNTEKAYLDQYGLTGEDELETASKLEDQQARIQQTQAVYLKRPLFVRLGQSPNPGMLTVDFADRGPGIQDPEIMANKKFIQRRSVWGSKQSRERGKGEHGIGLASLDEIVSANYGGRLKPVENPSGAQIRLTLPLVKK